jgi:hypothetical protein
VLIVGTLLLSFGAVLQRLEVGRHLLHGMSEFGQLPGDARYVLRGCDSTEILRSSVAARLSISARR